MTEDTKTTPKKPSPVRAFALVGETLHALYHYRRALVSISAVPAAIWALVISLKLYMLTRYLRSEAVHNPTHGAGGWFPATFSYFDFFLSAVLSTALAIACHRLVLLRTMPKSALGLDFGWRELRYIGYGVVVVFGLGLLLFLVFLPLFLGVTSVLTHGHNNFFIILPLMGGTFAFYLFAFMAFVRLSLVAPAIAVDAGAETGVFARLKYAWRLGRPVRWRLVGAWMIAGLIIFLIFIGPQILGLYLYGYYGGIVILAIIGAIRNVVSVILFAMILSLAYHRLGGDIPDPEARHAEAVA